MIKHLNIIITGRVQGVWYRGSTQKKARELGLNGFVRNEPDGSVYVELEGDTVALKEMINWCETGPELARVLCVEVEEGEMKNFKNFEILR